MLGRDMTIGFVVVTSARWAHRSVAFAVALGILTFGATSALAVDAAKAAQAMAKSGQSAYESADFARAEQLFLEAYRTDPSQPLYLYSAGRAAHVAGRLEQAEAHYRGYQSAAGREVKYEAKAAEYLADIARQRRDAVFAEAERAERASQFALAARLYRQAQQAGSTDPTMMFREGRALFRAGDSVAAKERLEACLKAAPSDAPYRAEAAAYLDQLRPSPPKVPETIVQDVAPSPPRWPAWSVVGLGAAAVVAGGALFGVALAERSDLDAKLAVVDASGYITGITLVDAESARGRIATLKTSAAVSTGIGAIGVGVGAWLLLREGGAKVTAVLQPDGVAIVGRF